MACTDNLQCDLHHSDFNDIDRFSFGFSCYLLHYGVFVEDLSNVLNIALRFLFYLTGIFWSIMDRLPAPYNSYIGRCNPIAFLLTSARDCVIYGSTPHHKLLLLWFVIGLIISALGVRKIYKNENSYVKVVNMEEKHAIEVTDLVISYQNLKKTSIKKKSAAFSTVRKRIDLLQ